MVGAARATRSGSWPVSWRRVSWLLAGLGLALATACAPTSKVATPPSAAQARPPAPQETPPLGTIALPPLPPGSAPPPFAPPPGGAPGAPPGSPPGTPGVLPPGAPPGTTGETAPPAEGEPGAVTQLPTVTIQAGTHVAILLPLSGPDARIGHALLDAAELAVFDFGDDNFVLDAYDTEKNGAAAAAQKALTDGAQLILGPLFARSVAEVANVARAQNVNVISFSNDRSVAGPGIFLMGLPPSDSILRALAYARSQGVTRWAALLPSDTLGDRIAATVQLAAQKLDAEVVRIEHYDPGGDAANAVKRVAEFERRHAAYIASNPAVPPAALSRNKPQTTGEVDYQALVLGEAGQRLRSIASLLPFYDIDPAQVHVIGTPAWEDQSLAGEPALVGAWFAAPDPSSRANFERKYRETYARSAPRIATLAYDAAGLAAVLARLHGTPDFSAATLTSPSGFAGVDGIFRFASDGVVERGLAVLQLDRRSMQVISPAPTSFETPVQ